MKKLILLSLLVTLSVFLNVFAVDAPAVSVKDVTNDIISVSGTTAKDTDAVSIVILNPEKTTANIVAQTNETLGYNVNTNAIQYFGATYPKNGNYTLDINLVDRLGTGGGVFKIIVTVADLEIFEYDYEFYFKSSKDGVISSINATSPLTEALVREAYVKFSLGEYDLYKNGDITSIINALEIAKTAAGGTFSSDPDLFQTTLKNAALLAGFNASKTNLLVGTDGKLKYSEILSTFADPIAQDWAQMWSDYTTDLNSAGVSAVNTDLISASYTDISQIVDAFEESLAFNGIMRNKNGGYAHLDTYFANYSSIYENYSFNISGITGDNRSSVYNSTVSCDATNLTLLASAFNGFINPAGGGGGGGTGGGGAGGAGGPSGDKPSAVSPTLSENAYIVPDIEFHDLKDVQWAEEAVMTLANLGVINGKEKYKFAPNDLVTRAEYLKMLLAALDIKSNKTRCDFTDVANDWSKPYIIAALDAGIAKGTTDTTFSPNGIITREMGAVFGNRALAHRSVNLSADSAQFADHSGISDYAVSDVYCLKNAGIISGVGKNTFNPKGNMTRAEAAKMIYEIYIYSREEITQ